jgi:hypothetical protein
MKNLWKSVLGMSLIGMALAVSASAHAASGVGPYYAVPSWAQKLVCSTAANCPRFIVLTDWASQAVLDRETGLVWQQTPSAASQPWNEATLTCIGQSTGGRMGWRLATVQELLSLLDPTTGALSSPGLPPGHPFGGSLSEQSFWSATQSDNVSSTASKYVVFVASTIALVTVEPPAVSHRSWCVRTPQGENPQ